MSEYVDRCDVDKKLVVKRGEAPEGERRHGENGTAANIAIHPVLSRSVLETGPGRVHGGDPGTARHALDMQGFRHACLDFGRPSGLAPGEDTRAAP